ncbi:hypothetical protein DSO57_1027444 [Entomophthora muscae]|uniref:Uncharacterized protein n=1 Tax=Entomophthora muscae TaxID=34485 RepID=A0ACC2RGH0_9FUNG|nr:hypothetical protein DSO57_1027444 [Entomophthora muscae]
MLVLSRPSIGIAEEVVDGIAGTLIPRSPKKKPAYIKDTPQEPSSEAPESCSSKPTYHSSDIAPEELSQLESREAAMGKIKEIMYPSSYYGTSESQYEAMASNSEASSVTTNDKTTSTQEKDVLVSKEKEVDGKKSSRRTYNSSTTDKDGKKAQLTIKEKDGKITKATRQ